MGNSLETYIKIPDTLKPISKTNEFGKVENFFLNKDGSFTPISEYVISEIKKENPNKKIIKVHYKFINKKVIEAKLYYHQLLGGFEYNNELNNKYLSTLK